MVIDFGARAQDFLKRITPLSADLAAHGRTRTLALQKLHRICLAEVRTLKARYTLATVKLALSKYRERDPRRGARSLGLALFFAGHPFQIANVIICLLAVFMMHQMTAQENIVSGGASPFTVLVISEDSCGSSPNIFSLRLKELYQAVSVPWPTCDLLDSRFKQMIGHVKFRS